VPAHVGLQGNLDPAIVAAGWGPTEAAVRDVLRRGGGNPGGRGGHVFNLGHGVLPETDPETLERVVELVHSQPHDGGSA
jgi:uroporphyrinogen decarboxylase